MNVYRLISTVIFLMALTTSIRAQETSPNQLAEDHIRKVMSEYKNPLAYYPLRKDIFLPTEQEEAKTELRHSYPNGSVVLGSFIFIKGDNEYEREPFVDAYGNRLFNNFLSIKRPSSLKGDSNYLMRKQRRLLGANPNLGRFLLFNEFFSKTKQLPKP